jgi:hypothetical protein
MARLPTPGSDTGTWGDVLNDYLGVEHNADGTLKPSGTIATKADDSTVVHNTGNESIAGTKTFTDPVVVATPTASSHATTKAYVDSSISAGAPDATATNKGIVQLAGDLSGTAAAPTVPGLATKEPTITAGTTSQYYRGDKTFQTLDKTAVGLANVDNTSDANKPVSTATQTALNAKEPTIVAGTTSQYWRGDKTWQTLDKTSVGLANVDNVQQQPLDSDLTAIAGLTAANDDVLQRKSGAWTNRTPAQLKTDLALTKSDVGLANVDNTSDANKPISTATQTALNTKVDKGTLVFNVKDYGATGDGVTNDQPGIGAAFNAAPAGAVVFLPAGTYLMNTRLIVSKSITIQGASKGSVTLLIAQAAFQVGASGVSVRDLTIMGSAGVQSRLALQSVATATNQQDWTFRDCKFDGVGLNPTRIGAVDANGNTITSGSDLSNKVNVENCEFTNYTEDGTLTINGTHNATVRNCWIYDNGTDINKGDAIKVQSSASGTRLMYNLVERSARDGIDCYDSKQTTIIGNVIRDPGVHGIEIKFASTGSRNHGHIVMGNRVINAGTSTPSAPSYQLAADHATVIGNIAEGGSNYGFRSGGAQDNASVRSKHVMFLGNQAIGNASHGFLFNGVDDAIMTNNVAVNNGGDGFNVLSAANNGIRMSNNVATGNTGAQYNGPSAPATATSTGSVGEVIYDTSFTYICVAPNTWRRVAIAAW